MRGCEDGASGWLIRTALQHRLGQLDRNDGIALLEAFLRTCDDRFLPGEGH